MNDFEVIKRELPQLLELLSTELKNAFQISIGRQFRDQDHKVFNTSDKLRSSRGSKSLRADFSKSAKVKIEKGVITVDFETEKPYAGIQNRGGFIKATPIQKRLEGGGTRKTYKMAQFFWAKYFEANGKRLKNIYKRIALSVEKRGGVNIKGKNYLENAINDFETNELERILEDFIVQILRIWRAN